MTENIKIAMTAINKWLFFGWNYRTVHHKWRSIWNEQKSENVPAFLVEAKWTCNFDHMLDKWKAATRSGNSHSYLVRFYGELDDKNRIALLDWVLRNYTGEKQLF